MKAPVTPSQPDSFGFVPAKSAVRVADPESTKISPIHPSQAPKRCSASSGVSQSRIEAPGWGSAGAGDGSGNHQAGFAGVGISRNSSAKRKWHHTVLRMLRNTAGMSKWPPDCSVRALRNSSHGECLGRGYSSGSVFVWFLLKSGTLRPRNQFRTYFLVLLRLPD